MSIIYQYKRSIDKGTDLRFGGSFSTFHCKSCKKQKNLKKLQFCGKFSVCYKLFKEFRWNTATTLINLQKKSNYIVCNNCKQKFYIEKIDDNLLVSTFICNHFEQKEKKCKLCQQLVQKKKYESCKKCSLWLFFFNVDRMIKCPNCQLVFCEHCKQEKQLFSQNRCNCRVIKYSKYLNFQKGLIILIIVVIILSLIFISYLEKFDYYNSNICAIGDGYSNEKCTSEQPHIDIQKQLIISIFGTCACLLVIPLIKIFFIALKTKDKLRRAHYEY